MSDIKLITIGSLLTLLVDGCSTFEIPKPPQRICTEWGPAKEGWHVEHEFGNTRYTKVRVPQCIAWEVIE